jgi:peptidoglycan/LPS O-acetylase OafA/YrhL
MSPEAAPARAPERYAGPERRRHGQPPYEGTERRALPDPTGLDRGRSSGLDGLRAFAALLVVAFHLKTVSGVSFGPLDPFVHGGDSGVYLFFALSGYLLYKPFVRGRVDLLDYAAKRSGRILPGYFVALVGLTVITGSRLPLEHPLPYLSMTAPFDLPLREFLGNAWTLTAELLFYVTLPLMARLAYGRGLLVLIGLGGVSVVLALIQRAVLTPETAGLSGTYPVVFYAFVPGMLLAVLEVRHPFRFHRLRRWPYLVLGIVFIALGTLTAYLPVALATGLGTALLMGWLRHHPLPGAHVLAFAGGASYALYLWHKDAFIAFGPALGLAIAVVASGLSWALIEHPILARVHAAVARRRVRAVAQPLPIPAVPGP